MGRSSPGDHDYLHGSESPRDRKLDSLHSNQEGPVKMGSTASVGNKAGVQGKDLVLLTLVCIMQVGEAFVKITVPEPDVMVPEGAGVNLTCLFSDNQRAGLKEVHAAWRQITTDEVFTEGIVTLWDMEQQRGNTTLTISHMQADQVGQFSCIVRIRESFDYGDINVGILKENGRTWQVTEAGKTQQELGQENLIVGLVRDFGQVQNTTSITACLPLPKAAGDPIPWGIIPVGEMPPVTINGTKRCNKEIRNHTKMIEETYTVRGKWSTPGQKSECLKLLNPVFTRIGRFKNVGWCTYDIRQKKTKTSHRIFL
ncbi:uncharacterized protein LOC130266619 [Oenanthe melanoleuca]|uniref:uncharacterized protein LOC130266619 n=1 Tax=Oenanthe melanoleuca TaxID=2939378 RepID=UPI0024C1E09D|nr:uncharacterized protein LOC130266619 [Oenanthe melanoleuca]